MRKIDTIFVENLKRRLQNDPNGPGVPPVADDEEEAVRLASRHNFNGYFNHKMTHRDYVRC